ncbi:InlB B-repeat-containing protein [Saccharibacillus sp. O23]|uniref:InlB B-repeat-containing protein n=1 Tax=Saccharibacillus sp. O23 TaxID=2009338 RepID=UPI0015C6679B|nr:InlB B-repeat-containing protein [Saccharibacillus sp. O23]
MNVRKARTTGWRHRSKILVWLLIVSILVSAAPIFPPRAAAAELPIRETAVNAASPFQDVSEKDWYYNAVVQMQQKNILGGTTADLFSPKGTMTRAMYVTALGRMAGVDPTKYPASSFADVPAGSWYAPYIEWAVQKGITDGTGSKSYSPNATVSREQMATMTLRYFESEQIAYQPAKLLTTQPRDLAKVAPWAKDAVLKLWQAGIFTGDEQGNFKPNSQATRAEAAVLFMRNNEVVEAWKGQQPTTEKPGSTPAVTPKPVPTTSTPTPAPSGNNGGGTSGGNDGGATPGTTTYTLTFESNGGTTIEPQKVRNGEALNNLPVPMKEGFIFQGWFADKELTLIFANGSALTADTKLYAKYTDSVEKVVQNTPSYAALDVSPSLTITIQDVSGKLTASEVQAGMTFVNTANSNSADSGITVTGGNGTFTVASAAEDGKFVEGNTYELTLKSDDLRFEGQDASTKVYSFSVAKQKALEVTLNPKMIYLPFGDLAEMIVDGAQVDSPSISVMTTTVGENADTFVEANSASGKFVYEKGETEIKVGDTVAIYKGIRPDLRTVDTTGEDNGDIAYVRITAVDGHTYTYGRADSKEVLLRPDVLPVNVSADTDGDPDNHSITVETAAMNYSDSVYEPFGLNELTTADVGDFIGFYEGEFAVNGSEVKSYGRITSITPAAEMDIITYTDATIEEIENVFNIYQQQTIKGEDLLSKQDIAQLEEQIEQQARDSGFVNEAADYLSDVAMDTQAFKAQSFRASKDESKVSVENKTVVASLGTKLNNINGRSSGVSATLQVGADIVVDTGEEHELVVHMTGTFTQELSMDLGVNGESQGHWLYKWGIPYWYSIDDYIITANLDTYSYTGLNIKAEMALVEKDKLAAALKDWAGEKKAGRLGKVQDIATQVKAVMNGVQDASMDTQALQEQYKSMVEEDTEWIPLIEKSLFEKSMRVALGIVEVKFEAKFVVSAQVKLSVGADFYYKMAKRYSVTLRVLSFTGSTNTVSLPGDGDYQFTFYVMGTLGLRAGIQMEVKAGVGSVTLNSIGLSVEPGVYINLWGYFFYQLQNINGVKTTKSLGALYMEIGIYLLVGIGAQIGDGALSTDTDLVDETWPLYTVGEQQNVSDFAYPDDNSLSMGLAGKASALEVPKSLLTMNVFDLKTGDTDTQDFSVDRFDIQVDNPNFRYNAKTKKVEVINTSLPVSKGNLVITWKGAPLAFIPRPIKRTVPLTWRVTAGEYILRLDPQNGSVPQVLSIAYNAPVKVTTPVYPGYTFDGWYTAAAGGTKVAVPSRMPKEDYEWYAQWKANTNTRYTIQHYLIDANTGKPASSTPDYTEVRTGTTGTEIRIDSDRFKNQGYANGVANGQLIKGDGSTVVRIEYAPVNRTATFDGGYPGAVRSTITEPTGKNIANRIPVPTRAGYTFAGWSPKAPSTMPNVDTTYTAAWTAKADTPYQVVYLKQNLTNSTYTVADTENYRGTTDTEANLSKITPKTYAGFTFNPYVPGTVMSSSIAGDGKTVLKLYYKRNIQTLMMDYGDPDQFNQILSVPFGASIESYLITPTRAGYTFAGWSPTPPTTMPSEDLTLTAQWKASQYTVIFNTNLEGIPSLSAAAAYGSLISAPPLPTREGYRLEGWYSNSELTTPYDFTVPVTGDITLYAKWTSDVEKSYIVSFDTSGGTVIADKMILSGQAVKTVYLPFKAGYLFTGWYVDPSWKIPYNLDTPVTEDLTLYAGWTPDPTWYPPFIPVYSEPAPVYSAPAPESPVMSAPESPIYP